MIIHVKLLVYDVWSAEEDRIGFLSVGVDIFDRLYLKERIIFLPMEKMSTKKQIYDKWDYVRKLNKSKYVKILTNRKTWKVEKCQKIYFDECWNFIFDIPLNTWGILFIYPKYWEHSWVIKYFFCIFEKSQ